MLSPKKFLAVISAVIFLIWILPLGVFIKPDQEEKACAGQRAICLCSKLIVKQISKSVVKIIAQSSSSATQKESAGGASHYFLSTFDVPYFTAQISRFELDAALSNQFSFINPAEHVPKA